MKLLFLLLFTLSSYSQENFFSLGLGGVFGNNIRIGNNLPFNKNKFNIMPIPAISFRYKRVQSRGRTILLNIINKGYFTFNTALEFAGDPYRSETISLRRPSWFGGVQGRLFLLQYRALTDFNSRSNSQILELALGKRFEMTSKWFLNFRAGVEYLSDKYVDFYFGVKPNETTDLFTEYRGQSTQNLFVGMGSFHNLSKSWSMNLGLRFREVGDEVFNSPTVRKSEEFGGVFFLVYRI